MNLQISSPPNSTGAYELDLTLVQNFSATWRAMHVKTDIFCGASLVLPDKAGRQISIAGWSLDSTFGVRLYTPDGSDGVNGTNDWQENYRALKLQVCVISIQCPSLSISTAWPMVPVRCNPCKRICNGYWR